MSNFFNGYSYGYGYGYDNEVRIVLAVLAVLTAVAATVLAFIFITPEKKRDKLPKFLRLLHDICNFNGLIIEKILKAVYIFATAYVIISEFFSIFTGKNILLCLLTMVLAPIAIRIAFELVMMAVLLVKNVISINNKLKNQNEGEAKSDFEFDYSSFKADDAQPKTTESFCKKCGAKLDGDAAFCPVCGAPTNK